MESLANLKAKLLITDCERQDKLIFSKDSIKKAIKSLKPKQLDNDMLVVTNIELIENDLIAEIHIIDSDKGKELITAMVQSKNVSFGINTIQLESEENNNIDICRFAGISVTVDNEPML